MSALYYQAATGQLTSGLRALLPHVSNPQCLDDAELASQGIARCVAEPARVEWWQYQGARSVDTSTTPHVVRWEVVDLELAEVKAVAWDRVKAERAERRANGVAHVFPDGTEGYIQIRDEDIPNLLSIHAAATTAIMQASESPIPFTDAENVTRFLAPADALAVAMAAFAHGAAVHVASQALRGHIEGAADVAGVVAAAVWPGV